MPETFEIRFQDKSFRIPVNDTGDVVLAQMRRKRTFYEADLLGYLQSNLPADGIVVDCGANVGNHTLFFSGVMGRRTVAIEPIEGNRAVLQEILKLNGLESKVKLCPFAIGESQGEVVMSLPTSTNPGNFRISSDGSAGQVVPLTTLDELLLPEVDNIALIKMDLEGYEIPALKGGIKRIERDRPMIIAELVSVSDLEEFHRNLQPFGYQAVRVFCATPTVLFLPTDEAPAISDIVVATLRKYQRKHSGRAA